MGSLVIELVHIYFLHDSDGEKVWKLVNIWWSYKAYKNVPFFGQPCITESVRDTWSVRHHPCGYLPGGRLIHKPVKLIE